MNTGINKDHLNPYSEDNIIGLEYELKEYIIFSTPSKRKSRFDDDYSLYYGNSKVERSGTSDQKSVKSSNSKEGSCRNYARKVSPKLSPFSKYCANLSPLYNRDCLTYKRQKLDS